MSTQRYSLNIHTGIWDMITIFDMWSRISIVFLFLPHNLHISAICENSWNRIAMKTSFLLSREINLPQMIFFPNDSCMFALMIYFQPFNYNRMTMCFLPSIFTWSICHFSFGQFSDFQKISSRFIWSLQTICFAFQSPEYSDFVGIFSVFENFVCAKLFVFRCPKNAHKHIGSAAAPLNFAAVLIHLNAFCSS